MLIRARKELGGRSRPALFCGRRLEILLNLILIFLLLPHLHRFLFSLLGGAEQDENEESGAGAGAGAG